MSGLNPSLRISIEENLLFDNIYKERETREREREKERERERERESRKKILRQDTDVLSHSVGASPQRHKNHTDLTK